MSLLADRIQFVYTNGVFSKGRLVLFGVPQGSRVGPLIFDIYVNDVPVTIDNEETDGTVYADDIGAKVRCTTLNGIRTIFNDCTFLLEDWCAANNLSLNKDKMCDIFFSYDRNGGWEGKGDPLKFLGIYLDSNLSWTSHVEYVTKKLSRGLYLLRRLRSCVDTNVLLSVYYAQIQSILCYGVMIWGYNTHYRKILLLQKRAVRLICNVPYRTHCKPLFRKLRILTFPSLYLLFSLCYTHNNKDLFMNNTMHHDHDTRNKNKLIIPQCRYSSSQKNYSYMAVKLYNALPSKLKMCPLLHFKSKIKEMLIEECLYNVNDFFSVDWSNYL